MNTQYRPTTGDNLTDIMNIVEIDALARLDNAEQRVGRLDARTALALLLHQALIELANYWPPTLIKEIDVAVTDLRYRFPSSLPNDASPAEVVRHASRNLTQLREDLDDAEERARQAKYDRDLIRAAYSSDIERWREKQDSIANVQTDKDEDPESTFE